VLPSDGREERAATSVAVEPILAKDLDAVARFLHDHMNPAIALEAWRSALDPGWIRQPPNHGFLLRHGDDVVGVFAAIYSEQTLRGRTERFCNTSSWCVLQPYRNFSLALAAGIVRQKGWHFTNLTATPVAAAIFKKLGFSAMDSRRTVIPWLPFPTVGGVRIEMLDEPAAIEEALDPAARTVYRDHRGFASLRHLCLRAGSAASYLVYKRRRWRRLPYAEILSVSRPEVYLQAHRAVGRHLFRRDRVLASVIERRLLPRRPSFAFEFTASHQKLFRSDRLAEGDISNLYSELIALDM
jgi:hypothetical protein